MEGFTLTSVASRSFPSRNGKPRRAGICPSLRVAPGNRCLCPPVLPLRRRGVASPSDAARGRAAVTPRCQAAKSSGGHPGDGGGARDEKSVGQSAEEEGDEVRGSKEGRQAEAECEAARERKHRPTGGPGQSTNPIVRFFASMMSSAVQFFTKSVGNRRVLAVLLGMCLVGALAFSAFLSHSRRVAHAARAPTEILYSDFLALVKEQGVQNAAIDESGDKVYFTLRSQGSGTSADVSTSSSEAFSASTISRRSQYDHYTRPVQNAPVVASLASAGVTFGALHTTFGSMVSKVLVTMLMLWLPMIPLLFLLRRMMDRTGGSRKRKGGSGLDRTPPVTFADVAGVDTAKMELLEVVACLRDSKRYKRLNAKMPSGVLLSGPPGTGKTLLAKAVAGEAGVPFFAASASEFVEMFVGRGAARVRDLFAEARKRAPCVVFIDELDAVGMKRGFGNNEERDQTLNQLLTELDGIEGREGVLLLAATNRPESLDPALLRPGRLSRKVVVPVPDEVGRQAILGIHLRSVPFDENEDVNVAIAKTARISAGFSGAELANVVNEAAMLAARRNADAVTLRELIEGVSRTRYGVDGRQLPQGSLGAKVQDWLLDIAAAPQAQKPSGAAQNGLTG